MPEEEDICLWMIYVIGMVEPMTKERAYAILGVDESATFTEVSLAYRALRDKYHPDKNPAFRKEYAEAMAAFKLLQLEY